MKPLSEDNITPRLRAAIHNWRDWPEAFRYPPEGIEALSGGLTNENYLILINQQPVVLRLETRHAHYFGINRDRESVILQALHTQNLCPQQIYRDKDQQYSLFSYIQGRVWRESDFSDQAQIQRLYTHLKKIQHIAIQLPRFNYLHLVEHYCRHLLSKSSMPRSSKFNDFLQNLEQFQSAQWLPVLCHHDLLPQNIIETPKGLMIIDWEYAGLGHPSFDHQSIIRHTTKDNDISSSFIDEIVYWINQLWYEINDLIP